MSTGGAGTGEPKHVEVISSLTIGNEDAELRAGPYDPRSMGPQSPNGEDQLVERRGASRVRLLTHAYFAAGRVEGRGILHDLSITGACINEASPRMKPGTELRLTFALREDDLPVRIRGKVVRETETGFAVEFIKLARGLRELLQRVISDSREIASDRD